jgi:hypothetical protein
VCHLVALVFRCGEWEVGELFTFLWPFLEQTEFHRGLCDTVEKLGRGRIWISSLPLRAAW